MVNRPLSSHSILPHEPGVKRALATRSGCHAREGRNMPVQRKVFRIEQMAPLATPSALLAGAASSQAPHQEIVAELQALRALIERRPADTAPGDPAPSEGGDLCRLKQETESIHRAINHTKREIATV